MKHRRLKILFVLPSLGGGGAEGTMVTLLRHLDRSHFEPHLALVSAKGPHLTEVPEDVAVHDLRAGRARIFYSCHRSVGLTAAFSYTFDAGLHESTLDTCQAHVAAKVEFVIQEVTVASTELRAECSTRCTMAMVLSVFVQKGGRDSLRIRLHAR